MHLLLFVFQKERCCQFELHSSSVKCSGVQLCSAYRSSTLSKCFGAGVTHSAFTLVHITCIDDARNSTIVVVRRKLEYATPLMSIIVSQKIMEVSVATENTPNVETLSNSEKSGQCLSTKTTLQTSSSTDYMVSDCLNETERKNQGPKEDLNECYHVSEVPSQHSESKDLSVIQSACEGESKSTYDETISPIMYADMKNNIISKENLNESNGQECNLHSEVCENSDSHSDFLSAVHVRGQTEKVLVEPAESRDLSSVGHSDAESEKIISKNNEYCSDTSSHHSLTAKELLSFSEEIEIKNESEEVFNEYNGGCSVTSPKVDDVSECFADPLRNKDLEFSTQNFSGELHPRVTSNDDSDTISADEKDEKDDVLNEIENPESASIGTCLTGKNICENQQLGISDTALINKKGQIGPGNVFYQCIKCNFTDKRLEQLSLHVLTCTKKRKYGRNEAYRIDGEVPPKTRFLCTSKSQIIMASKTLPVTTGTQSSVMSQAKPLMSKTQTPMTSTQSLLLSQTQVPVTLPTQSLVLTRSQDSVTSQAQPYVLTRTQVPVTSQAQAMVLTQPKSQVTSQTQSLLLTQTLAPITSNAQFIITPRHEFLTSSQTQHAAMPKSQLRSASQSVITKPQAQRPGAPRAVHAHTTKTTFTSASRPQLVISPQTPLLRTSKSQGALTTSVVTTSTKINTSAQAKNSVKNVQPIISLPTQLPIATNAQLSSLSKRQVTTSSPNSLSIPPGTKITIGPQAQIPIALSPQGNLRIAQAGSQILITTKPVQHNPGALNQPTLLGLGIGTNPTVAPKNIVLLPNLLLNSGSSTTGKVNGKQISTQIQGQFIFQNAPLSRGSVAAVQLQNKIIYTAQSVAGQPTALTPSTQVITTKPKSSSVVKPTIRNAQQHKLSFALSAPTEPSSTVLTGVTNALSSEQSTKQATFICEICDDYVNDLEKLRNHMQCLHQMDIHPKIMPSFNCQKCQFCFFTEQGLERHLVGSHGLVTASMQEAADEGKDGGRCPICGWGYQSKLLHHVSTDHKMSLKPADLSYKCTLCTATFGVYKQFEVHVYSAHRPAVSKFAPGNSQSSQPIK